MTMATGRPRPRRIAHRGHTIGAPEQTKASYEAAIRLGADMIEADVRRTRDGVLVMLHDATLDRTTDRTGPVADRSLAELADVDAGSWFRPEFRGARIPTLDELFDVADSGGVALCLEAKGETPAEVLEIALAVGGRIAHRGRLGTDVLSSFDHDALAAAARQVPGLGLAPDRLPERGLSSVGSLVEQARAIGAGIVQHHHLDLTADVVAAVQALGIEIWAWPVNTIEEITRCHAMGVIGLMGDDVAALVEVTRSR
jgi:glycerophosphoryl diester phosphodiesterase